MKGYVIAAIWVVSLVVVGWWQNDSGRVAERTAWQTRENDELRTTNAKIKALEESARNAEQANAMALAAISTDYERKLSDANKQRTVDAAAVRSGSLRLRDPGSLGLRACGSLSAEASAGAGKRDGGAPGELSGLLAEFLISEANRADEVAIQLRACQAVVVSDRAVR